MPPLYGTLHRYELTHPQAATDPMLEALTAVFGGAIPTLIGKAAEKVLENRLGRILESRDERRQASKAYHQAMQEWLIALVRNFQSLGYDDDELRVFFADYMEALQGFLADEEASEELLRPFTDPEPEPRLDVKRLLARWDALGLPDLPEDFNARGACTAYVKALTRKRIITPELRALYQAQITNASHQVLRDIRGAWPEFDLNQYARAVRPRYQTLDLSALAPAGRDDPDERTKLRDVFVPQAARRSRLPQSLPRDYLVRHGIDPDEEAAQTRLLSKAWGQAKREPILELIAADDAKHCVILGDPGAGKSVITRYLLLSLLDEGAPIPADRPAWRERLESRLPFLIELREYIAREDEKKCDGFLGYLHYLGAHQGFGLNVTELHQSLHDKPSLVMFDGLDEIFDPKLRYRIAREITGFALEYESARVLVTSRIAGFDARPFEEAGFAVFTLDELDDGQIKTFIDGWFKVAYPNRPDEAESRQKHVLETLKDRPAIRALAGNPLLLTIIAIIARHEQLPNSRKDLYAHALNVMCHNWDFRRHLELKDSPLRNLEADHKLTLLRRIAWRMQEGGGLKANAIEESELRAEIEKYFEVEWRFDRAMCIRCSREMIDVLQRRNHIICPYGPGLYGFIHRTFLEYLCAAQIIWRFEKDRDLNIEEIRDDYVLRHATDDAWHEVIRLLIAQLQPQFARELITALVPVPAEAYRQTAKLQLAFECLAEREPRELTQLAPLCNSLLDALYAWVGDLPDSLQGKAITEKWQFAEHISSALAAVGASWPDPALGRRGLPPTGPRAGSVKAGSVKYAPYLYTNLIASLVGSIWSELPETEPLLRDRAVNDQHPDVRCAALDVLAEHFREAPETKILLLDRASNDQHPDVRSTALRGLAYRFHDAPETELLLRDCTRDDEHPDVSSTALWALAQHFRDVPETEPLLLDRGRNGEHSEVRSTALRTLAEHFRDAPETKPLLLDCAGNDEHPEVRSSALRTLAEHFRDAPETEILLLERACNDEHEFVRSTSLRLLAQHFRDAPETKRLLLDRASNDEGGFTRSTALRLLAQHFHDARETKTLLLDRASHDQHRKVRGDALISWAQAYSNERNARLLSRGSDGMIGNGLDPHEPVSEAQVEQAAKWLCLTPDEVRTAYEELARQVPLRLSWLTSTQKVGT